jgi:hypothetical protein
MRPIENRIVSVALARIRRHRTTQADRRGKTVVNPDRPRTARRRTVQFADFEAVADLKRRQGLRLDSTANWQRLWQENPVLRANSKTPRLGWVLEADDGVVGYLGSIPLLYQFGDRTLSAVATTSLAVDPSYRALTPSLVGPFFHQEDVDLYLATTATDVAGRIAKAFKGEFVPQREYGTVLFWVLNPLRFASALQKRMGVPGVLGGISKTLISAALCGDRVVRARRPRCPTNGLRVTDIHPRDIDEEFEGLWIRKLAEGKRLLALRTPAVLRWHFDIPGDCRVTRVLCCHSGGRLRGYAVVQTETEDGTGLCRSTVADLLVENDDLSVVTRLLVEVYEHAKSVGGDVLEVLGFPPVIRNVCLAWAPYSRAYPQCPFLYRAAERGLREELAHENAWYAGPYDGDTTIVTRVAAVGRTNG